MKLYPSVMAMVEDLSDDPLFTEQLRVAILRKEIDDLRDAIKLVIGRERGIPWTEVAESDVDAYLNEIRRLKGMDE